MQLPFLQTNTIHATNYIIICYAQEGLVLDMLPRKLENTSPSIALIMKDKWLQLFETVFDRMEVREEVKC